MTLFASLGRPYPRRDWLLVLATAFSALVFFAGYAAYLFFGMQSGLLFDPPETKIQITTATRGEIVQALDRYRLRKTNYEADNLSVPLLPNPAGTFKKTLRSGASPISE